MTENKGDLISREALNEHKFVGIKYVQIGGKTLESINKVFQAYQQGWNDAIDSIIDNAPTVEQEVYMTGEDYDLYMKGYIQAQKDFERQGEWIFLKANEEQTDGYECSVCKMTYHTRVPYFSEYNFCPNCGAKMKSLKDCTKMHIESC